MLCLDIFYNTADGMSGLFIAILNLKIVREEPHSVALC
jgi:hypothetical protein